MNLSRENAAHSLAQSIPAAILPVTRARKLRMTKSSVTASPQSTRIVGVGAFVADVEDYDTHKSVVQLAVNGRVGRRVVCVYHSDSGELETFDMEGEEDEEDEVMGDESLED
jgi:hypothetical protein